LGRAKAQLKALRRHAGEAMKDIEALTREAALGESD
jgi:hypothetical protein